jgi:predicted DNA-binding transcriptional regulator AlpA
MVTERFCTGPELRAMLKISRATYYRMLEKGLPTIGSGRLRRHPVEAALRWYDGEPT